ncbi:hypothetical protein OHC51_03715 [Stenotrophomonas indicatrix]|uniref:hypothetical protein n=1 Tax=Stenotrophomonas indicatrix TaxID=2045451 RepID=UPI00300ABC98
MDAGQAQFAAAFVANNIAASAHSEVHSGMREPQREALQASEMAVVLAALAGQPVSVHERVVPKIHEVMVRAATITDAGFRMAVANGGVAAPERLKAGGESAALRAQIDGFVSEVTQGKFNGLQVSTEALERLLKSGQLDGAPGLRRELASMLTMDEADRIQRSRSDAMFALMVMLMTLIMHMAEKDRNQGAVALGKSEDFIKAMGEAMIGAAREHYKGAVIAFAVGATIAVAGVVAAGAAAYKNVQSSKANEVGAIEDHKMADKLAYDGHLGQTASPGNGQMSSDQRAVLDANGHRSAAGLKQAQHHMNLTQNGVLTQGGQAMGQMSHGAGNIAQADGDLKAAEQTRIQENFRKSSEVSKATADNQMQRANEENSVVRDFQAKLSSIMDEGASTADAFTRNMGA